VRAKAARKYVGEIDLWVNIQHCIEEKYCKQEKREIKKKNLSYTGYTFLDFCTNNYLLIIFLNHYFSLSTTFYILAAYHGSDTIFI